MDKDNINFSPFLMWENILMQVVLNWYDCMHYFTNLLYMLSPSYYIHMSISLLWLEMLLEIIFQNSVLALSY